MKSEFYEILLRYEKKLDDSYWIVTYLRSYEGINKPLRMGELVDSKDLIDNYVEYLKLLRKYEGEEKEFFKEWYLPIEENLFGFFLDLSGECISLFDYSYAYIDKEYSYLRRDIFDNINDVLIKCSNYDEIDLFRKKQYDDELKLALKD